MLENPSEIWLTNKMRGVGTTLIYSLVWLVLICAISIGVSDELFVPAIALILTPVYFGLGWLWLIKGDLKKIRLWILLIGVLLGLGLALTHAPLRVAFVYSEPEFDSLAERLMNQEDVDFPLWVGPFRVVDGGIREGAQVPYLMTSGDVHEINGFVRHPTGYGFNIWSMISLGGNWSYVRED